MSGEKRMTPKRIIYHKEEFPEHDWVLDKDGAIDKFAMEFDFHNGPACKRCGYAFCIYCEGEAGYTARPCIIEERRCPTCNSYVLGDDLFCRRCGQALLPAVTDDHVAGVKQGTLC